MLSIYAKKIAEITGYRDPQVLSLIENFMREELFHSTLDWVEEGQFLCGVRESVKLLIEFGEISPLGRPVGN